MTGKRSTAPPRRSSRAPSDSDQDTQSSPYIPPPPDEHKRRSSRRLSDFRRDHDDAGDPYAPMRRPSGRRRHRSERDRGYSMPREKHSSRLTLLLSRYSQTSMHWHTAIVTIDPYRENDIDAWSDIRNTFRTEVQKPWKRILGFKKVKSIQPIKYTPNGIPLGSGKPASEFILGHAFMHAYHHPERLNATRWWIDWFEEYERDNGGDDTAIGLQFTEGLWADKLAAVAILLTAAIIITSAVWCALGGDLQTVFTVMSFVLGGITAELALVALYFQVTSPG